MATVREQQGQDFYNRRKSKKEESTPVKQRETGATEHLGRQGCDELVNPTHAVWHSSDQIPDR